MARRIEAGKFLVIECTAGELMDAVQSGLCVCDFCDKPSLPNEVGYYIAVLNQWYCKKCFDSWLARARYYPEDADVERRNFNFYARRFGLIAD